MSSTLVVLDQGDIVKELSHLLDLIDTLSLEQELNVRPPLYIFCTSSVLEH